MSATGAKGPEGRGGSGIGFYFNADDTWHSDSEAPPRVWDPAWIAPLSIDGSAEPQVRRRRSGLAVALGLALMAAVALALAWSLTPARRLSPPVRQTEPPSAVLVPPLPAEPPAPAAPPVAKAAPAPAPVRTERAARPPAVARLTPHYRQHLRTSRHRRSTRLKRHAAHGSKAAPAGVRPASRHAYPAAHGARHGHRLTRIRRASKAVT
jgi:hypothetical protein